MGQIWLTGDTHGAERIGMGGVDGVIPRLNYDHFPEQRGMTKEDLVIVLGDFGVIFNWREESSQERNCLKWLEERPFSLCFIDGNHENFDRLYAYPEETWNGGRVHVIRKGVRHLIRGQIYTLSGLTFFTFGGARSHDIQDGILDPVKDAAKIRRWKRQGDKFFRERGKTWWPQELPSYEEMQEGRENLEKQGWKVDHCLTHDLPPSLRGELGLPLSEEKNELDEYLEEIRGKLSYGYWWGGHHHCNRQAGRHIVLYEQLVRVH